MVNQEEVILVDAVEVGKEKVELKEEDSGKEILEEEKEETMELVDSVELEVNSVVEEKEVVKDFSECLEVDLVEVDSEEVVETVESVAEDFQVVDLVEEKVQEEKVVE